MTILVKGVALELDMLDAADNARATQAIGRVSALKLNDTDAEAQTIVAVCHAVFECFNAIFGVGTDKKIFGDKCNMREALEAFAELTLGAKKQKDDMAALLSKYSPDRLKRG